MVKISAVLNCACLIGLERIGQLSLLPALLRYGPRPCGWQGNNHGATVKEVQPPKR